MGEDILLSENPISATPGLERFAFPRHGHHCIRGSKETFCELITRLQSEIYPGLGLYLHITGHQFHQETIRNFPQFTFALTVSFLARTEFVTPWSPRCLGFWPTKRRTRIISSFRDARQSKPGQLNPGC